MLDLRVLKESLNAGVVTSKFHIFKWKDNAFLPLQYAHKIAKIRSLPLITVNDICEVCQEDEDVFGMSDVCDSIKLYSCQKFELPEDFKLESLKDVIVICQETSIDTDVYEFPKLEDWQIKAYMKSQCKGLKDDEINWLFSITSSISKNNENIYRLDNEMKKIGCFNENEQESIFRELSNSNGYCDLSPLTIFNFTNAILKKDKMTIINVLEDIESIDVEGVGLITILHKNFKQLIDVQIGKNITAESLGMSIKQFKAVEYNCGKYTSDALVKVFEFITGLDYKLKSGQLDIGNQRLIDYIVCSVLAY